MREGSNCGLLLISDSCMREIFIEEIKNLEVYDDEDYSQLYNAYISNFTKTDGLPTSPKIQRAFRFAINRTVDRVQAIKNGNER